MQLTELVEIMVKAMVDDSESVKVRELQSDSSSLIELSVSKSDMGIVIGKKGKNAQALRTILSAAAAKLKGRVMLDLID